jgi:hypothetical protein
MQRLSAARQLALWVGRKTRGSAYLRWGDASLTLFVDNLQIVAVEGDDGERLASAFGLTTEQEWFREARAAVAGGQVTQGEANAVVKRALAGRLREFFLAPDATVAFETELAVEAEGLTISFPHLLVEMVLGPGGEELVPVFLPDEDLVLLRLPDFPRRVGALGLTDEALAVFAKINDVRTAREIVEPSPHQREMVLRLMAAAVGAGLVDATPRLADVTIATGPPDAVGEVPQTRRWAGWLLVLIVLGAIAVALGVWRPWAPRARVGSGGPWAVAVDGGCQPAEVERLYRQQDRDRENYQVVPFGEGTERCYRLVWGHFPDRQTAEREMAKLPAGIVTRGFVPHVVKVESSPS